MTLNHNCGYFSTVAGIAGNALICETLFEPSDANRAAFLY